MDTQPERPTVVVGIDGSEAARGALLEAVRSASRRGGRVRAITAYEPAEIWGPWSDAPPTAVGLPDRLQIERAASAAALSLVSDVLTALRPELGSTPEVEVEVLPGRAADLLPDLARDAVELVVGHRGRGSLASAVLGSVGWACVLHAPCAVTVVPSAEPTATPTVVVGVDGSDNAGVALRYAWQQAVARHARLRIVMAYEAPDAWAATYGVPALPDGGELRRRLRDVVSGIAGEVQGALSAELGAVPWDAVAEIGSPVTVLSEESRTADLLVIGHRGRGGLRSALLGSAGLGCVIRSACPTTVVPMPVLVADDASVLPEEDRAAASQRTGLEAPLPVGPIA